MSTTQQTLTETVARLRERAREQRAAVLAGQGAVYGRDGHATATRDAAPAARCRGCERRLSGPERDVARVLGDDADTVPACRECASDELESVHAASVATTARAAHLKRLEERDGPAAAWMHLGGEE